MRSSEEPSSAVPADPGAADPRLEAIAGLLDRAGDLAVAEAERLAKLGVVRPVDLVWSGLRMYEVAGHGMSASEVVKSIEAASPYAACYMRHGVVVIDPAGLRVPPSVVGEILEAAGAPEVFQRRGMDLLRAAGDYRMVVEWAQPDGEPSACVLRAMCEAASAGVWRLKFEASIDGADGERRDVWMGVRGGDVRGGLLRERLEELALALEEEFREAMLRSMREGASAVIRQRP